MDWNTLSPHIRLVKRQTTGFLSDGYVDPDHVFTYVAEGGASFLAEGYVHNLQAGSAILLPPLCRHLVTPLPGSLFVEYVVHFDPTCETKHERALLHAHTDEPLSHAPPAGPLPHAAPGGSPMPVLSFWLPAPEQPHMEGLLRGMLQHGSSGAANRFLLLKAAFIEVLARCLPYGNAPGEREAVPARGWATLRKALDHLHDAYPDPMLDNARVAAQAGVTPNHLTAVFHQHLGLPLGRYLARIRIDAAKRLLSADFDTITLIAEKTGHSSIHAFCRAFRRETGMSPGQYAARFAESYPKTCSSGEPVSHFITTPGKP